MVQQNLTKEEYNKIYAALKLIEALCKQGRIEPYIFKNILDDYKDCIDISEFRQDNFKAYAVR